LRAILLSGCAGLDKGFPLFVRDSRDQVVAQDGLPVGVWGDFEPGGEVLGRHGRGASPEPVNFEPQRAVVIGQVVADPRQESEFVLVDDESLACRECVLCDPHGGALVEAHDLFDVPEKGSKALRCNFGAV
jgi:hypothetical protein